MTVKQRSFVRGMLSNLLYYDESNHYAVFQLAVEEASEEITQEMIVVIGKVVQPKCQHIYVCYGTLTRHASYGWRYQAEQILLTFPRKYEAIVNYLASSLFQGIGKKTATKIVNALGEDALALIVKEPELLAGILSKTKITSLIDALHLEQLAQETFLFLYSLNLSDSFVTRIFSKYGEKTKSLLQENPYCLLEEIDGLGFKRIDMLAHKCGISKDAPMRFQAAVIWVLKRASQEQGHLFLPEHVLLAQVSEVLDDIDERYFTEAGRFRILADLWSKRSLIVLGKKYYLPALHHASELLAMRIKALLQQTPCLLDVDAAFWTSMFQRMEQEDEIVYAEEQKAALQMACTEAMSLILGGPGTGKTFVLKSLCKLLTDIIPTLLQKKAARILLAAPTGRAAKRMSEATRLPAMTVHRLLGWFGEQKFTHGPKNPLEGDILIVDEVSMLDVNLAYRLFQSIPKHMRLLFVGDPHQLPSVGPGHFLQQLISIDQIKRVVLQQIFRQKQGSSIIRLASAIKEGELGLEWKDRQDDYYFLPCRNEQIVPLVVRLVSRAMRKGYSLSDVQVLVPMYKGLQGIDVFNQQLQAALNSPSSHKPEVMLRDGMFFRQGDKVLQIVNHPEKAVYNGEIGFISALDPHAEQDEPILWVKYDDAEIPYVKDELGQMTLAYACSIHKAQGSEFPVVVMPVLHSYGRMLQRNLLYTGVTRSQTTLILCGEWSAFALGVKKQSEENRYDCLSRRLIAAMR